MLLAIQIQCAVALCRPSTDDAD
ncbi:hypothetical protein BN1708_002019 [Verticillium longisporum]|uniref:Uncharacterized protein n=1 Tax=Verticillium longisporum TaxID=100787 RepID=A0A0G4KGU4_VERLO|nr:hypothetical protein BN1708_002019 [Verticillium longisporum]